MSELVGRIAKIAYTPVKGTALQETQTAYLTPEGIVGDKEYMIVQAMSNTNGVHRWVSQRDQRSLNDKPQSLGILALIQSHLTKDALHMSWVGQDPIAIPRDRTKGKELKVEICRDTLAGAVDQGSDVAEWLKDHLDFDVRLVKVTEAFDRPVSSQYLPNDHRIRFQDGYPLHWITKESLADLSQRANQDIPWTRFRPNIIVEGTPGANFEHTFFHGSFGDVPLVNAKPCTRCPVPLVNQETGQRGDDGEPLKTLSTYKRWRKADGSISVIFGENALPLGEGEIVVGQEVTAIDFRDPPLVYDV